AGRGPRRPRRCRRTTDDGAWPSGKARDFGSRIRRFESSRPNHSLERGATMTYELKLLTGNANRPLAEEIAQYLRVPLCDAEVSRFSDGEVYVQINENVRGADVFVIQPTCPPVNDTLMELLIMIDALKRVSPPDHGGAPLLRLRAPGPEGPAARADHRQARGRPPRGRGHQPCAGSRPPCRPNPGVLQGPGRPPLRRAGRDDRLPAQEGAPRPGHRGPRRGRRGAGARHRQAVH